MYVTLTTYLAVHDVARHATIERLSAMESQQQVHQVDDIHHGAQFPCLLVPVVGAHCERGTHCQVQ